MVASKLGLNLPDLGSEKGLAERRQKPDPESPESETRQQQLHGRRCDNFKSQRVRHSSLFSLFLGRRLRTMGRQEYSQSHLSGDVELML